MVKTDTLLIVAAIAAGGYLVWKSDIASGIGDITEGAGEAALGLGGGISAAAGGLGEGVADIAGDISQTTGNIADFLNPLGALGSAVEQNIEDIQAMRHLLEEQKVETKVEGYEAAKSDLIEIEGVIQIREKEEEAFRREIITEEKSQWVSRITQADDVIFGIGGQIARAGLSTYSYSPMGMFSKWMSRLWGSSDEQPEVSTQTGTPEATQIQIISPQASTGSVGVTAPTISGGSGGQTSTYLPSAPIFQAMGWTPTTDPITQTVVYEAPVSEPEPEQDYAWYDPRGWF